jgi:hypothetical protein
MTKAIQPLVLALLVAGAAVAASPARAAEIPLNKSAGFGMTWAKLGHNATYSADEVGCSNCNPYTGDTACSSALPILCVKTEAAPNPGLATDTYNGWIGGQIYLTAPVAGNQIGSVAGANARCAAAFGAGYQIAEFHHPSGGWNWYAYGNVNGATRFWVNIGDQSANCWNP